VPNRSLVSAEVSRAQRINRNIGRKAERKKDFAMSVSLIVIIPLVLVGLVGTLCFVGCVFPTGGLPFKEGPYAGPILNDANLVAFWPLDDVPPSTTALATPTQFNGQYLAGPQSSSAPTLNQPGIVPGDVALGAAKANTCALFNGGLVSVGFAQALNPPIFTLECWVQPKWTAGDPQLRRAVLVSADTPMGAGYALFANQDNFWEIDIGTPGQNFFSLKSQQPINLNATNYLAVTYDGSLLTLFVGTVGGVLTSVSDTPTGTFVAEQPAMGTSPSTTTPLFIGMGRPDTAGLFPFNGFIQDVAVYSTALGIPTINTHFANGAGG
jgi:Concanavalin A-like lectin/glucanases superfamily